MDIFESLENLEISEECFNDIMDIVEEILGESLESVHKAIEKKHGKPEYDEEGNPANKSAELKDKFTVARNKEYSDAYMRDYEKGKDIPRGQAGHRECTTHASFALCNRRYKTNAQKNAPTYSDEHKDEVLKRKEEMRKKHAEISGGKKGTGGMPYKDFIEELRKISIMANKNHHTKGGKGWK